MAFKEGSKMSNRREFVTMARIEGANIRELCRRLGIDQAPRCDDGPPQAAIGTNPRLPPFATRAHSVPTRITRVCSRGGPEFSVSHDKRNVKQSSLSTRIPADVYIRKISELNVTSADLNGTSANVNVHVARPELHVRKPELHVCGRERPRRRT